MKIDELGQTWNSVEITDGWYYVIEGGGSVPVGHYKVSHDAGTISLQAVTMLADGQYDIVKEQSPYVLDSTTGAAFINKINNPNDTTLEPLNYTYKQYFYDIINYA